MGPARSRAGSARSCAGLYERDPVARRASLLRTRRLCDRATRAELAKRSFPSAHVYDPKTYVRVALGRGVCPSCPRASTSCSILGGDLMHAVRLHGRLHGDCVDLQILQGTPIARRFARFFAVDAKNVEQLRAWHTPEERIAQRRQSRDRRRAARSAAAARSGRAARRRADHAGLARLRSRASHSVLLYDGAAHRARGAGHEHRLRHLAVHAACRRACRDRSAAAIRACGRSPAG